MKKHNKFAVTALTFMLSASSAFSAFAGFVHTDAGYKYQWPDGSFCTNNWVHTNDHWYYFGSDELMRTGWIQRDGTWYYASDTGELNAGAMQINGNVYFFDKSSCKLVKGAVPYQFRTYEFTENGVNGSSPYVYTAWDSYGNILRGEKANVPK